MDLRDKIAVITHGLSSIGMATAQQFIREGAMVVLCDTNTRQLVQKAKKMGAMAISADISRESEIKYLIEKTVKCFGRIDIFFSNAGNWFFENCISYGREWKYFWQQQVTEQMWAAKYLIPMMIKQESGYILNSAPEEGLSDEFHTDLYSTIRHPALSFAERLTARYAQSGIKVSIICPGNTTGSIEDGTYSMRHNAGKPAVIAEEVVHAMREEQFYIFSSAGKTG